MREIAEIIRSFLNEIPNMCKDDTHTSRKGRSDESGPRSFHHALPLPVMCSQVLWRKRSTAVDPAWPAQGQGLKARGDEFQAMFWKRRVHEAASCRIREEFVDSSWDRYVCFPCCWFDSQGFRKSAAQVVD